MPSARPEGARPVTYIQLGSPLDEDLRCRGCLPCCVQNVPFRRFWTGQTISLFGDEISMLAIPLLAVLVLHADATQVAC